MDRKLDDDLWGQAYRETKTFQEAQARYEELKSQAWSSKRQHDGAHKWSGPQFIGMVDKVDKHDLPEAGKPFVFGPGLHDPLSAASSSMDWSSKAKRSTKETEEEAILRLERKKL